MVIAAGHYYPLVPLEQGAAAPDALRRLQSK
jgi:hypothetical protein